MKKTPITYYGGKQTMLKYILPIIPEHRVYCEPFFGGGAVFFAKSPSAVEIINDVNNEVINFYKVVKTKFPLFKKEIDTTLYSRELHRQASVVYHNPDMFDDIKRAWAFFTLANQSFSSSLTAGWGYSNDNKKGRAFANKCKNFTADYKARLEYVQIERQEATKVIKSRDSEGTFFYCDPPYYNANMGHYGGYTKEHFDRLLNTLKNIRGKFLLSSYPSGLLKTYIKDCKWYVKEIRKQISVTKKQGIKPKTKVEVLTANYDILSA